MNWGDINIFAKHPVFKSDYLCSLYFLDTERNMIIIIIIIIDLFKVDDKKNKKKTF